ncbi:RNA-directed DNA polymerase, partial [Listeria fleischmannii FSL S10-1203]
KYFYMNDNPVVIMEGKTDIVYLKAALKKLHEDYPRLISKQADGAFEFKITFLNRKSKRLIEMLNLKKDGADTITKLIEVHYIWGNATAKYFKKNTEELLAKKCCSLYFR